VADASCATRLAQQVPAIHTVAQREQNGREQMAWPEHRIFIRDAVRDWLRQGGGDLPATMHLPRRVQAAFGRFCSNDEMSLSKELRHCLNRFDRKVHRAQYRRHGIRVSRLVVLEHQQTVGWHAHLLLKSPPELGAFRTSTMLSSLWHEQVGEFATCDFDDRLYWAGPLTGDYFSYATKYLDRGSEIDWNNTVL